MSAAGASVKKSYIFSQNPGAGFLLGSVTVYMDSYRRARLGSAALCRRYNVRAKNYICIYQNARPKMNRLLYISFLIAEYELYAAILNGTTFIEQQSFSSLDNITPFRLPLYFCAYFKSEYRNKEYKNARLYIDITFALFSF